MGGLIGIFGGTFDPPHLGHVILAHEARWSLNLERVLWVVTGQPPHKPSEPISPSALRVAMVAQTIENEPAFELSRVELDRKPPHFAVDTVRALKEQLPKQEICYLMGADSLMDLPNWHNPQGFIETVDRLGVMQRPPIEIDVDGLERRIMGVSSKTQLFPTPHIDISSTMIRARVAAGLPYQHFIRASVAYTIEEHKLYLEKAAF